MNLFGVLEITGAALLAERIRAEVVASNMANAETTRTPEGGPYQRKQVFFRSTMPSGFPQIMNAAMHSSLASGVSVAGVVPDASAPQMRYEPAHPDANGEGYVAYPAINPVQEMVDLMGAARAYELNATAVQATKQMIQQSIELLH